MKVFPGHRRTELLWRSRSVSLLLLLLLIEYEACFVLFCFFPFRLASKRARCHRHARSRRSSNCSWSRRQQRILIPFLLNLLLPQKCSYRKRWICRLYSLKLVVSSSCFLHFACSGASSTAFNSICLAVIVQSSFNVAWWQPTPLNTCNMSI